MAGGRIVLDLIIIFSRFCGGGVRVVHVLEVCSCTGISLPCNFIWLIHVLYALFVFIFNCF